MTTPNKKLPKKPLVKARKPAQPGTARWPVLPSARARKLHQLALQYHAEEQAEVQRKKEQEQSQEVG